jgi:restriction system protein
MPDATSPLINVFTPDLLSRFVGRGGELSTIQSALDEGVRAVLIFGPPGTGKSSLARVFAEKSRERYPGGVFATSASLAESPRHLLSRVLGDSLRADGQKRKSLLILDEVDALDREAVKEFEVLLKASQHLDAILTSRDRIELSIPARFIELRGLNRREFSDLLRLRNELAHGQLDDQLVQRLFHAADGNALFANLAVAAVNSGLVTSWQDLFDHVREFAAPGLLGPDGQPLKSDSEGYRRVVVDASATNADVLKIIEKEPAMVWELPPRKFEEIVAEILSKKGYEVSLTPASGDGGFDIYAAKKEGLGSFLYLVECKRYVPPNKVGVEIVRSLYGVVQLRKATAGAIVTTSYFTAGAEAFQREVRHQLHLHDYIALQKWIKEGPLLS